MIAADIISQTVVSHHNPSSKARNEVYQVAQEDDYEYMASTPTTVAGSPKILPAEPPILTNPPAACFTAKHMFSFKSVGILLFLLV